MDSDTLFRYISGSLSRQERRKVFEWISSSEENRTEYLATRRLYDIGVWNEPIKKHKGRSTLFTAACSFAACLAALIVAGAIFHIGRNAQPETPFFFRTVSAPPGKEIKVELADGTLAWLNSNSTLTVMEDGVEGARTVYLEGEGYFNVAHDSRHPFIVKTSSLAVKVLGTEFNVSAYPDGEKWETALFNGSVAILNEKGDEVLSIKPGTKVEYKGGSLVASSIDEDMYRWRDGIIYFDNLTTREILDRLAAYYDLDMEIQEGCRLGRRYTGKFRTVDGYEHILRVLKIGRQFEYTIVRDEDANVKVIIQKP